MSYHTCKHYRVYQRYVDTVLPDDKTFKVIHDYAIILYKERMILRTEYAFEMIKLLDVIHLHFGYDVPEHLINLLEDDVKKHQELRLSKDRVPSIYAE